jgi:hypothetical protein
MLQLEHTVVNRAKRLSELFGGKWKYDNQTTWWCDDGKRHVSRCCSAFDESEMAPSQYWLYGDGGPKLVRF